RRGRGGAERRGAEHFGERQGVRDGAPGGRREVGEERAPRGAGEVQLARSRGRGKTRAGGHRTARSRCFEYGLATGRVAHFLVVPVEALLHLAFDLIALPAVSLLQRAGKLVHRAVDPVKIVVGELAPPLLDLTAHLLPLAGEDVLIHEVSPPFGLIEPHQSQARRIPLSFTSPTSGRR